MKQRILAGLCASLAAATLPLLICGMGKKEMEPLPPASPSAETVLTQQRTVREIVVHQSAAAEADRNRLVTVEVEGTPAQMTLADYLTGVLMGEMPASFEMEALKAQAVAARTYTLRRLEAGGTLSDDPAVCQAFIPLSGAPEKLGEDWEALLEKFKTAVRETDGQVLTYEGELISATYFSASGGKTESAQAVWGGDAPYLVSVESPGEDGAESAVSVPLEEFLSVLEIPDPAVSSITYTEGGGVDAIVIGGKAFSGTELRQLFGLKSTCFSLAPAEDSVLFQVRGSGHRVGLSQYGAQAMAREGKDYGEILRWYYTGVTLCRWDELT